MIDNEVCFIDYHESRFKDVDFECDMLLEKHKQGYVYGTHWLPHDAKAKTKVGGGRSMLQQFLEFSADNGDKLGSFGMVPSVSVQQGIQAVRASLPFCRFDNDKCDIGVDHCKAYRREFDEENNVFTAKPKHDGHSHAADGLRSVGLTWKQSKAVSVEMTPEQKLFKGNVTSLNFGQLKKEHFKRLKSKRSEYLL